MQYAPHFPPLAHRISAKRELSLAPALPQSAEPSGAFLLNSETMMLVSDDGCLYGVDLRNQETLRKDCTLHVPKPSELKGLSEAAKKTPEYQRMLAFKERYGWFDVDRLEH